MWLAQQLRRLSLMAFMVFAVGSHPGVAAPDTLVPVVLNVTVHRTLDDANLRRARDSVAALMASAGIRSQWHDCHRDGCPDPLDTSLSLDVLLLPQASRFDGSRVGEVMRNAALRSPGVLVYVPVLRDRLQAIQRSPRGRSDVRLWTLAPGDLVGLTIAHEIGHALGLHHDHKSRIMKAQFDADDFVALRRARFDHSEGSTMRASLQQYMRTAPSSVTQGPSR
jgi:hypothetical protein